MTADDSDPALEAAPDGGTSMSTLKRWIALVAGAGVALAALAVVATLGLAVRESNDGANPDDAFSATELIPESLGAPVSWAPDAPDLARAVEPTTRESLAAAWIRADDALVRAADGDLSGLDVWFTGPAAAAAQQRFARSADDNWSLGADAVRSPTAISHDLRAEFYSLDGQIVILRVESEFLVDDPDRESGDTQIDAATSTTQSEVILVLSDGNWRIRNIERLTDDR